MANIRKRGDSYQISVFVGRDENGKQKFEYASFTPQSKAPTKIKNEVETFARLFEDQVKNGKYRSGNKITFGEYYETWKSDWAKENLTLSVMESYERMIRRDFLPVLKDKMIAKIRVHDIQPILDAKKDTVTVSTLKYMLTAVNSVFRYAFAMDVIDENPCDRVHFPRERRKTYNDLHFFTIEQCKTFLSALDRSYLHDYGKRTRKTKDGKEYSISGYQAAVSINTQWKSYFYLAIYGGFRRGELIALTWEDIDFNKRMVSINKASAMTKAEGQIVKSTKTRAGEREIVLPKVCFDVLASWKNEQRELSMKIGSAWEGFRGNEYDKNNVFIQMDSGKMMCLDAPSHKFREVLGYYNESCEREEDKLPLIKLHDLRHTSVTQLLANGVDIETVSHRHGHSNASVTMDVYGHWTEKTDHEASDKLESLFG